MKACDLKKLQASTDKNFIARLFRNNFVTMASIGWTHPGLALEVFKCFVPQRNEFRDFELVEGWFASREDHRGSSVVRLACSSEQFQRGS